MKIMKKKQRKKRKKTSSGEEDDDGDEDDDSDDFELSNATAIAMNKTKKQASELAAGESATLLTTADALNAAEQTAGEQSNDEAAAKALQASENKRRSARAANTSKKQKYSDGIKDEDLLMPVDPNEEAGGEEAASDANIVLQSAESLIVDKILGIKLTKRKTMRKKEKKPKERKTKAGEEEKKENVEPEVAKTKTETAKATDDVQSPIKMEGVTDGEEEKKVSSPPQAVLEAKQESSEVEKTASELEVCCSKKKK